MPAEAASRGRRYSGEGSRGFAQTSWVHAGRGKGARKADARRAGLGRKMGRSHHQRGGAATRTAAAAHHTGVGVRGQCARRILDGRLGLRGRLRSHGTFSRRGLLGSNRMSDARYCAMRVKTVRLMVPIRSVTDMGFGGDRRELNGDQKDRRSNHSQQCAGQSHAQLLPYGPSERNSASD